LTVSHNYETNLRTLTDFYNVYNPSKVSEAKSILDAYAGREEMLFERLHDLQVNGDGTDDGQGYEREEIRQEQEQEYVRQQQQSSMPVASEFTTNATKLFNDFDEGDVNVGGDGGGMNPFSFDHDDDEVDDNEEESEEGVESSEEENPAPQQQQQLNIFDDDLSSSLLSPAPVTSS
jgi:hypothetical protein